MRYPYLLTEEGFLINVADRILRSLLEVELYGMDKSSTDVERRAVIYLKDNGYIEEGIKQNRFTLTELGEYIALGGGIKEARLRRKSFSSRIYKLLENTIMLLNNDWIKGVGVTVIGGLILYYLFKVK